jgi:hypothetical protein
VGPSRRDAPAAASPDSQPVALARQEPPAGEVAGPADHLLAARRREPALHGRLPARRRPPGLHPDQPAGSGGRRRHRAGRRIRRSLRTDRRGAPLVRGRRHRRAGRGRSRAKRPAVRVRRPERRSSRFDRSVVLHAGERAPHGGVGGLRAGRLAESRELPRRPHRQSPGRGVPARERRGTPPGSSIEGGHIVDLAPTVFRLLGLPRHPEWTGSVLPFAAADW